MKWAHDVVLSARKADELQAAVSKLIRSGIDAQLDRRRRCESGRRRAPRHRSTRALGEIDILVNNAGASWGAPAEDHPLDAWDKVMNLNVRGIFLLTQAVGRASMIPRRTGRIINVASIAGLSGNARRAR